MSDVKHKIAKGECMTGKYQPLEKYLRGRLLSQVDVTLTFTFIEQILNESVPASAQQENSWWGNQKQAPQS